MEGAATSSPSLFGMNCGQNSRPKPSSDIGPDKLMRQQSVANIYPNSLKRKRIKANKSTLKNGSTSVTIPNTQGESECVRSKIKHGGSASGHKPKAQRASSVSRVKPTANNGGMKHGALIKYLIKPEMDGVHLQQFNAGPMQYVEVDLTGSDDEGNDPPEQPVRPVLQLPHIIHATPTKSGQANGKASRTEIETLPKNSLPRMQTKSTTPPKLKTTPPPEGTAQDSQSPPARRNLHFSESSSEEEIVVLPHCGSAASGRPPVQRDKKQRLARVEAFRRRYTDGYVSSDEFSDNECGDEVAGSISLENENPNQRPCRKQIRNTAVTPLLVSKRRESENSNSSSLSIKTAIKRTASEADLALPKILIKALKRRFGDSVKALKPREMKFRELEPVHLSFLLRRTTSYRGKQLTDATSTEHIIALDLLIKEMDWIFRSQSTSRMMQVSSKFLEVLRLMHEKHWGISSVDEKNCYWPGFVELFFRVRTEKRSRSSREEERVTTLLEKIISLVEFTQEEYMKSVVKVKFSFMATIFQGSMDSVEERRMATEKNFKELVQFMFTLTPISKEFKLMMTLLNLAVDHYCHFESGVIFYHTQEGMVQTLWDCVKEDHKSGHTIWLEVIKSLKRASFGKRVAERFLWEEIEELRKQKGKLTDNQLQLFLKAVAASCVVLERVPSDYDRGSIKVVKICTGDTPFHRACAKRTKSMSQKVERETSLEKLGELLDALLDPSPGTAPVGDINARDNNNNTCLHDACQHGRLDAIKLLVQRCWHPEEPPSRTNLDILAQDTNGNTPLHIALSSLKMELLKQAGPSFLERKKNVVKELVKMADGSPKKKQILFETLNNKKESIYSYGVEGDLASEDVTRFLHEQYNPIIPSSFGGLILSDKSLQKIKSSKSLQSVFAYWEHFHDKDLRADFRAEPHSESIAF